MMMASALAADAAGSFTSGLQSPGTVPSVRRWPVATVRVPLPAPEPSLSGAPGEPDNDGCVCTVAWYIFDTKRKNRLFWSQRKHTMFGDIQQFVQLKESMRLAVDPPVCCIIAVLR